MKKMKLKTMLAVALILCMAYGGGVTTAYAKGKDHHPGKNNSHKAEQAKHKKQDNNKQNIKHNNNKNKNNKKRDHLDLRDYKLEFRDVDMDWAKEHIARLVAKGVFEGYSDGTFQPNKPVSRLEALVTAVRLMDLREEAESAEKMSLTLHLKDDKQIADWARGYVAVALEQDLFFENEDKLQPNKPADRLWVTTMLVKALGLEAEARSKMNTPLDFKDAKQIPAGSVGYVVVAVEKGIVKGYANQTFQPNKPVTRAEIAAFLDRTSDQMPGEQPKGTLQSGIQNGKLILTDGTQYNVDPGAYVFYKEQRLGLDNLRAGDVVSVVTYNDFVIFIKVLQRAGEEVVEVTKKGTLISSVTDNTLSFYTETTVEKVPLHKDVEIFRGGVKVRASELQAGDLVHVNIKNGQATLVIVEKKAEHTTFTVEGTVEGFTLDQDGKLTTITIRHTVDGNSQASIYSVSSTVTIDNEEGNLGTGQKVELKGEDRKVTSIQVL